MEDVYPPIEWREIPDTDGLYSVSSTGLVRHNDTGYILSGFRQSHGYRMVTLSVRGHGRKAYVHRLVATAFLGEPKPGQVVNHMDNDPTNNRVENLEWTTYRGNIRHAIEHGYWWREPPDRRGAQNGRAKLIPEQVAEIRRLAQDTTQQALAERYGVSPSQIGRIVRGEQWAEEE